MLKDWPLSDDSIRGILQESESAHLEFKRDWYDLDRKEERGEFLKDVFGFANSLHDRDVGLIVFGRADDKDGGEITGLNVQVSEERVLQILAEYAARMPRVQYHERHIDGARLGILRIEGGRGGPYYTRRTAGDALRELVYVRRGQIVTPFSPAEFEDAVMQRRADVPSIPVHFGFSELPTAGGYSEVKVQVQNVSPDPVPGVSLVVDAFLPAYPGSMARWNPISQFTLYPAEQTEVTMTRRHFLFQRNGELITVGNNSSGQWVDLRATLSYRDHHGVIRTLEQISRLPSF